MKNIWDKIIIGIFIAIVIFFFALMKSCFGDDNLGDYGDGYDAGYAAGYDDADDDDFNDVEEK